MYPPPPRLLQTPIDVKQKSVTMWSRNVDTVVSSLVMYSHEVHAMITSNFVNLSRKLLIQDRLYV